MELGLRGRTAIVCGGSAGMGLGVAEALAAAGAAFLASDAAADVTGAVIPVAGGLTRSLL